MIEDRLSLEDLLLATLDAVSRFRVGQRDTVGAALDAGAFLAQAKGRLQHGEWGNWLHRVGLAPRTASMWMKLVGMGLGRVHTKRSASKMSANEMNPRKITSSFSKREKMRRNPFSRRNSLSISLRLLYISRSYSHG